MHEDEQLLECPICFEQMTEDIAFPFSPTDEGACTHNFCMRCMKGIYDLAKGGGRFPHCPICRRTISSFARNQLATQLVVQYSKIKTSLREVKDMATEREQRITAENEDMAQRISELEGELVRSNSSNQGEVERSGHMKKMLQLMEGEKSILAEHLQEVNRELYATTEELESAKQKIEELEEGVHRLQSGSARAQSSLEEANATIDGLQASLREKNADCRRLVEEKQQTEQKIEELEEYIERSDTQLKRTLSDYENAQSRVSELEQTITAGEDQLLTKKEELLQAEKYAREMEARFKFSDAELQKSKEEEYRLERRVSELEAAARKSDSERANNGAIVSQLEGMLNMYKQEARSLEEEKYDYGKKIALLEGALAKFKIDLRKAEDERNGFKERAWKAERDAEIYKKEMDKIKVEFKEREDSNKQSGYLSGFMKKTMNLNPLTAFWGDTKPTGPLVRSFSDLLFFERRGSTKDSCVWRGKSKATGAEFAIKRITDAIPLNAQAVSDITIFREALLLKKIDHPSITKVDSVVLEKGCLYFTYSPFVSMDLEYASSALKLSALQIKSIVYQLLCAVNYLHRQELVHRNLKPTSVLMSEDCNIKLCGFSQSRSILGGKPLDLYIPTQPVNYTAPEVFTSEFGVSMDSIDWKAADIWSIGCIFAELLVGDPIFSSNDRASYLKSVSNILDSSPLEPREMRKSPPRARMNISPFIAAYRRSPKLSCDLFLMLIGSILIVEQLFEVCLARTFVATWLSKD